MFLYILIIYMCVLKWKIIFTKKEGIFVQNWYILGLEIRIKKKNSFFESSSSFVHNFLPHFSYSHLYSLLWKFLKSVFFF